MARRWLERPLGRRRDRAQPGGRERGFRPGGDAGEEASSQHLGGVLGERNRQTTNVALMGSPSAAPSPDKAEQAANLIAEKVITSTSTFADAKIETLQERLDAQQAQLDVRDARLDDRGFEVDQAAGLRQPTDQLLQTNLLDVRSSRAPT